MSKIKFSADLMKFMNLFQSMTGASVKDCIEGEERLTFIVPEGEIGKAVGKKGANVRRIENAIKRKVKIVEYSEDKMQFIRNLIYPLKAADLTEEEDIITITGPDTKTKGLLIGRNAKNLRAYEAIVKRYFDIEEIKVI